MPARSGRTTIAILKALKALMEGKEVIIVTPKPIYRYTRLELFKYMTKLGLNCL